MHYGYSRRGTSPYDPVFATTSVSPPPHCVATCSPLGSCSPVHPFHPAYSMASTSPAHQQLRHCPPTSASTSPSPASSLSPPHRQQQQRLSALRARSAALRAGMRVRLSERGRTSSALSQHDVGTIVRADGPAHIAPYKVQAPSGAEGWYAANELVPVDPGDAVPPATVALTPGAVLPPPPLGGGGAPGGSLVYHVTANRGVPIGLSCKLLGGNVVVAYVEPHSPAHNAGLTPGCVVRSLGGVPVTRLSDVKVALARLRSGAHLERVVLPVEVARTAGAGVAGTAPVLEDLVQERMEVIAALQRRSVSPRRREAALRAQHDEARAAKAADPVYYNTPSPSPSPASSPRVGAPQTPPLPPVTSSEAPPPPVADALAASVGAASQPASVGGGPAATDDASPAAAAESGALPADAAAEDGAAAPVDDAEGGDAPPPPPPAAEEGEDAAAAAAPEPPADKEDDDVGALQRVHLEAHNALRSKHGAPAVVFDAELAKHAQAQADANLASSTIAHGNADGEGQNVYMSSFSGAAPEDVDAVKTAVDAWYAEISDYKSIGGGAKALGAAGHFTQVVWKESVRVGLGIAKSNGQIHIVANYHPPGNMATDEAVAANVHL